MKYHIKGILSLLVVVAIGPSHAFGQEGNLIASVDNSATTSYMELRSLENAEVLIVGGGSSHNFERWFNLADSKILSDAGGNIRYTSNVDYIKEVLPEVDILYLSNNQPIPDADTRKAIFEFVESGNDLIIGHAAIWYNWNDWPEYNRDLIGGGSRGHDQFGSFEVQVVNSQHPVMEGVPETFQITDELYYFETEDDGSDINVLAKGTEPGTGKEFPVIWTVNYGNGQILCFTLGHDEKSHNHEAYQAILQNTFDWFQESN